MLPSRFSEKRYLENVHLRGITLSDLWERNARECPDREAVSDSRRRLTWGEAKTWIDRVALGLIEHDFNKTDTLVVQLPNCVELNLIRVACERAGCLCLPLNPAFRRKELAYSLEFVKAKGIVIPYESGNFNYYELVRGLRQDVETLEQVFVVGETVPEKTFSLDEMTRDPIEQTYPVDTLDRTKCKPMEFSTISTTTGTTGFPKFVERAICSHIDMSNEFAKLWKVTSEDVIAMLSPSSGGPNVAGYFLAPLVKARVAMLERFNSEEALQVIEREGVTILPVVPTMLIKMVEDPKFSSFDLSSLRFIISIGSPIPYQVAMDVEERMGAPIVQRYGSVDSGLCSTTATDAPRDTRFLTVGRPLGDTDVKLVDDHGTPVPEGETGEVLVRVKREFSGYFNDMKATLESWTGDGWFRMGDLGRWDDQGNLVIVGRKKEMIIRGGQNIYPGEIEELILRHEKVRDIAIIGIPDKTMGQRACACIVPTSPGEEISVEEMAEFLKDGGVSSYKWPERAEIIRSLPMEKGGQKVDKKTLSARILQKLRAEGVA